MTNHSKKQETRNQKWSRKSLSEIDTNIKDVRIGNDIKLVITAVFQTFKRTKEYLNILKDTEEVKNNQI